MRKILSLGILRGVLGQIIGTAFGLALVGIACVQFFRLDWRRDALRIAAVLAVFFLAKKALLFAYGHFIQQVVLAHAG